MVLTRWSAVLAALLVVVGVAPVWARYGALAPGHGHGGGDPVDAAAFEARAHAYAEAHSLPDGSVEGQPGPEPVPVILRQFGFQPRELRLRTGERYTLELLAVDVMHGFSLQAGAGSVNALVVPGQPTRLEFVPTRPGRYLVVCNDYCGLGHQAMSGAIVVEGEAVDPAQLQDAGHDAEGGHEDPAAPPHEDAPDTTDASGGMQQGEHATPTPGAAGNGEGH